MKENGENNSEITIFIFIVFKKRSFYEFSAKNLAQKVQIEDLTWVVISYEMTTSVRFCLSYDCLKWDFIALKVDNI